MTQEIKFVVDINAGKLARWLRVIGYDTLLFTELDDSQMIRIALGQDRIILTKDRQVLKRRVITSGKVKAILIRGENPKDQLQQVVKTLDLDYHFKPFTLCLECNNLLIQKNREEVKDSVPPYVYKTQEAFMECPSCHRVYWQGTHWQAMNQELGKFTTKKSMQSGVRN